MAIRNYGIKRVFIDREDELARLKSSFEKVKNGIGQIVVIKGEHGIGKTKIVEEFKKYIENDNTKFLSGRCKRAVGRDPYQPFIDAFNINLQMSPNEPQQKDENAQDDFSSFASPSESQDGKGSTMVKPANENLKDTVSNNNNAENLIQAKPLGLIPFSETDESEEISLEKELVPPPTGVGISKPLPMGLIPAAFRITEVGDIKKGRSHLYEVMTKHLLKLAANNSVVLFIDDLQLASLASFGYIEYLTEKIKNKPIMVLFTISTDELDEKSKKLDEIFKIIGNLNYFTEIVLYRFDITNTSAMIKKIFSRQDVPESFIDQIYKKTEGNPLFIEDVIRALIEEDVIDVSSYVWQTRLDVTQLRIPENTREVLITKLSRLDKNILKVLGYAAVIGREFSFDLLKDLTEISDEKLLDSIDILLEAKLIHEDLTSEVDQYRFSNPLIQNISYNELSRSRRRFLHTKVGNILEQENINDPSKVIFKLADHFSKGRNYDKALNYLILAGDRAAQIYAIDDARRFYLTALELLTKFDYNIHLQQREIELLSNLGHTCKMLGDWDQSLEYYRNIPKLIDNLKNKITVDDESSETNKEIEMLLSNWIPLKMADTYWNLAELMRFKSDWTNAEWNYKKSLIISQEVDDYHGIAQAERGRGDINWRQGNYGKALDHYDICIDFATKINDIPVIAVTYINIGNIHNYTGDWDQAIAYYKESIEHLEKIGWLHEMGRAYNGLGEVYSKLKNWSEAINNFEKCGEISNKIGDAYQRGWALFNAAECHAKMQNLDKAMEDCKLAEEILTRLDDRVGLGIVNRNFGIIYHYKKDWKTSTKYFEKSSKQLQNLKVPFEYGYTFLEYGLMQKSKGDEVEAKKLLKHSLEIFKNMDAKVQVQELEKLLESK